jgi:riboflavin-specific deaminase-like protein
MRVAINIASTIDGKIAPATRGPVKFTSRYDSRRMAEIRAESDAVVMGAGTFRAHPYALTTKLKKKQPITVVVSRSLRLPKQKTPLENAKNIKRIFFCGKNASLSSVKRLEAAGVEVIRLKTAAVSPKEILKTLFRHGVKRVLLEGGGELNALFLEKNLVDRIHLTLAPSLLGGKEAPTLFEGTGFSLKGRTHWRLKKLRRVGQELYLTYER